MSYVRAFAPWIAFALIPSGVWQWGALTALILSVLGIARQARAGLPLDAQIIEIGSAAYFAALAALAFADPHTSLHAYTSAMASGALGIIGLISLAVRKPFTLGVAKQTTPRELWDHPRFIQVNVIITSVWTASFVIGAVALGLLAHSSAAARIIVQTAAFAVPMIFTVRYVARVQAKVDERMAEGAAAV
jgi:hypothetical protein